MNNCSIVQAEKEIVFSEFDRNCMERALQLAATPVAAPHPNPRVGCVIADGETIVGEGYHEEAGSAHAEVNAIRSLSSRSPDQTMYVTLEPCASQGRTPPCVDAVLESGIKRVVVASEDPNLSTNGSSIRLLREKGVDVRVGLLSERERVMNRGFHRRHKVGRPWVTVKVAASVDGKIATKTKESQWITGEDSRVDVHRLRANSSAILTGVGTIRIDDPRLTCRLPGVETNLIRVVLDSRLSIPADSSLFDCGGEVILATTEDYDALNRYELKDKENVSIWECNFKNDYQFGVDAGQALELLAQDREVNNVLVEAGREVVGELLDRQLVDDLVIYLAPSILGDDSVGIARIPHIDYLWQRISLTFDDVQRMGEDLRICATVKKRKYSSAVKGVYGDH